MSFSCDSYTHQWLPKNIHSHKLIWPCGYSNDVLLMIHFFKDFIMFNFFWALQAFSHLQFVDLTTLVLDPSIVVAFYQSIMLTIITIYIGQCKKLWSKRERCIRKLACLSSKSQTPVHRAPATAWPPSHLKSLIMSACVILET